MRVKVQIVDDSSPVEQVTEVEKDLFDEDGEVTDGVLYPNAISQIIVLVRAAVLACYGYDKAEYWEPIIDALP